MQAAQLAHLSHRLPVDVADAVPEKIAGRRLHKQTALADPEPRPRVDAPKGLLALDLAQAVPVSARFHLFERCPLLPSPADVLALVAADQATFGRSRTQSVLHSAGLADVAVQRFLIVCRLCAQCTVIQSGTSSEPGLFFRRR